MGRAASELTADFGAQRVKDLSLLRAGLDALTPKRIKARRGKNQQTTSLIEQFNYPKYGPGQMWEKAAEIVSDAGTKIVFDSKVTGVKVRDGRAVAVTAESNGVTSRYECTARDLVDADGRAAQGDGPAATARGRGRRPTG